MMLWLMYDHHLQERLRVQSVPWSGRSSSQTSDADASRDDAGSGRHDPGDIEWGGCWRRAGQGREKVVGASREEKRQGMGEAAATW